MKRYNAGTRFNQRAPVGRGGIQNKLRNQRRFNDYSYDEYRGNQNKSQG